MRSGDEKRVSKSDHLARGPHIIAAGRTPDRRTVPTASRTFFPTMGSVTCTENPKQ